MRKESIQFLTDNLSNYNKLLSIPDLQNIIYSGIITKMQPDRMVSIIQEVIPGYNSDLTTPMLQYQVIVEAYRQFFLLKTKTA